MSTFHPINYPEDPRATTEATWALNRDEAATIWYALSAYKASLLKDVTNAQEQSSPEDEMFLLNTAAKVAKLMYELRDDHSPAEAAQAVRRWLDTE